MRDESNLPIDILSLSINQMRVDNISVVLLHIHIYLMLLITFLIKQIFFQFFISEVIQFRHHQTNLPESTTNMENKRLKLKLNHDGCPLIFL